MISLPLVTERLSIAMMRAEHLPALLAYRNDPDIARYQDWDLPFTASSAQRLIDSQSELDGPANDEWVQLAVRAGGAVVGDVAVGVHDDGRQANIGYSIATAEQRKGYATEAVGAVVDALFVEAGLHRIVASIDPQNSASRRVLEKLGFRFEGRSLLAAFVRGEWVDDDRFALLATERPPGVRRRDDRT
jgi:aminoglycoside 6'-N-acetyltransferase